MGMSTDLAPSGHPSRCTPCSAPSRAVRRGGSARHCPSGRHRAPENRPVPAHAPRFASEATCRQALSCAIAAPNAGSAATSGSGSVAFSLTDRPATAGYAAFWDGRSGVSSHETSHARAMTGVTLDRPSRHVRAQRANAAPASCRVPVRRTSSSQESPSTRGHTDPDARPRRRSTIPGDASAASWYQAALST